MSILRTALSLYFLWCWKGECVYQSRVSQWSFPLFLWPSCVMIQEWYCKENFHIVSVCQTNKQTDKQQTDWSWPMTVNKLYTSRPANHIMAKQTNHIQQTRLYNIIDWQLLFTWLWRWLPHRLSKHQSPTTVLFRTTLTRTITLHELLILLGSNHLLY